MAEGKKAKTKNKNGHWGGGRTLFFFSEKKRGKIFLPILGGGQGCRGKRTINSHRGVHPFLRLENGEGAYGWSLLSVYATRKKRSRKKKEKVALTRAKEKGAF